MFPDEVKKLFVEIYQNYIKPFLIVLIIALSLLIIVLGSILAVASNNFTDQIESEVQSIQSTSS